MPQIRRVPTSAGCRIARIATMVLTITAINDGPAAGQTPTIQNGRVETRPATALDAAVTAAASAGTDPVWIGWSVPKVAGDHSLCSQWTPDAGGATVRLASLEASSPPQTAAARPAAPVRLEGGTALVVLARIVTGRVERLRTLDDECPIDAGGRTVHWLTGINAAESVRYLDTLARDATTTEGERRIATSAITAMALHRDPAADAPLDRMVATGAPDTLARHAAMWIGSARGAHGFATLQARIRAERDPRLRRTFVGALGQTREPATPDALLALARDDADPGVRTEAVHWYALRAPTAALSQLMTIIGQDRDDAVKRRAVSSLGSLPADTGVPALIQLARTGPSPVIRKEAVSTLGRSTDARARAFLEELVAR